MKKNLISLMIALMAITLFSSCNKDDDSSSGGNPSVMNAKNVMYDNSDIVTVNAVMEVYDDILDIGYVIATAPYQNHGFKLALPDPPSTCLYEISHEFDPEGGIVVSDPNAKIGYTWALAYDINNNNIGDFFYWGMNTKTYVSAYYVYADRNFTIKGKIKYDDEDEYFEESNCSFKKGWNIIYYIDNENSFLTSTKKPSGIIMEWGFSIDGDLKSTKHQTLFQKMNARRN